jgi:hypothetical protein
MKCGGLEHDGRRAKAAPVFTQGPGDLIPVKETEHDLSNDVIGNSSNGSRSCRLEKCFLWQRSSRPSGCSRLCWDGLIAGRATSVTNQWR